MNSHGPYRSTMNSHGLYRRLPRARSRHAFSIYSKPKSVSPATLYTSSRQRRVSFASGSSHPPSRSMPIPPVWRRSISGLGRAVECGLFLGSFGSTSRPLRPPPRTSVSLRSCRLSRHDIPSCTASHTERYACGMVSHATT